MRIILEAHEGLPVSSFISTGYSPGENVNQRRLKHTYIYMYVAIFFFLFVT